MALKKAPVEDIKKWIFEPNLNDFGRYLISSTVHGKPGIPVAEIERVQKIILESMTADEQFNLAKKLSRRPEYTARNISAHLITSGWPKHQDEIEEIALRLANDEDWIVREFAAGAFARLLSLDFKYFALKMDEWNNTQSAFVKRAIIVGVKYHSKSAEPKNIKTYLKLINPLMSEEHEYIRKNLGPFAIGDGLLGRYSDEILLACKKWSVSKNENVRWNTAMIFTAATAKSFKKSAEPLVKNLMKDHNKMVSAAAKKAAKNLNIG